MLGFEWVDQSSDRLTPFGSHSATWLLRGPTPYERALAAIKKYPTLHESMRHAHEKWQSRYFQYITVLTHTVSPSLSCIKPLLTIIMEYHGRTGIGDLIQINLPSQHFNNNSISSSEPSIEDIPSHFVISLLNVLSSHCFNAMRQFALSCCQIMSCVSCS
jgi:hypothetical protein